MREMTDDGTYPDQRIRPGISCIDILPHYIRPYLLFLGMKSRKARHWRRRA